jgi:lysozyme
VTEPRRAGPKTVAGVAFAAVLAIATPFVVKWEGSESVGYADVIGIATACIGHTGPEVVVGKRYSDEECRQFFASDAGKAATQIDACIHVPLRPNEVAAVLSLAFNAGGPTVCKSTMVRLINEGQPAATWCSEFSKWVYAGGRKIKGLVNRRADEMKLCLGVPRA